MKIIVGRLLIPSEPEGWWLNFLSSFAYYSIQAYQPYLNVVRSDRRILVATARVIAS